jgi:nucleotide-binding universal stress UspA family protein
MSAKSSGERQDGAAQGTGDASRRGMGHSRLPLGNVVVGTDFTRHAHEAVVRAAHLPIRPGATITIVHVLPPLLRPEIEERLRKAVAAVMSGSVATAAAELECADRPGVDVGIRVESGRAAEGVAQVARETGAELVVVGRGQRRGASERLLGSTAERIVRAADASVLVVSSASGEPYRRPLVAVDLSDLSRHAVELAIRISDRQLGRLDVLHACDIPYTGLLARGGMTAAEVDAYVAESESTARGLLEAWVPEARAAGVELDAILRRGEPRRVIARELADRQADLAVVGASGHSRLGRLLLGSVAESVMRQSGCDVLIVRRP